MNTTTTQTAAAEAAAPLAGVQPAAKQPAQNAPGVMKRSSAYFIDPKAVDRRKGWNPRIDFGDIEELAKSIKAQKAHDGVGLLNDIRVKRKPGGRFELIDGDRRLTAIELLMKRGEVFEQGIPAKIVDKDQEDIDSLIQMFVANTGKNFLPMEEAVAYKKLRDAGMTLAQICQAVGRKQPHVTSILALLEADESLQEAAKDGSINKSTAKEIALLAKGDKGKQAELVKQAKEAGKDATKRRTLKTAIQKAKVAKAKRKGKVIKMDRLTPAQLSDLGNRLSEELAEMMESAGIAHDANMYEWSTAEPDLKMAFLFGALSGCKAAAGLEVEGLTA